VVIVDDFVPIRKLVAEMLRSAGCTVVSEAGDGREALDVLGRLECDLVVMDLNMPVMNGLQATRAIRERHPDIRVVAFTSDDNLATARSMIGAGAEHHFDKAHATELVAYIAAQSHARSAHKPSPLTE
jgi:CheY-like chemotaxis protein